MLRDGLFSTDEFRNASRDFVLLRLTPGPAEARFGITAAPMAAVADGYGRLVAEVDSTALRGPVPGAVAHLKALSAAFDRKAASRPPPPTPAWAERLLAEDGGTAMAAFLESVHPRRRGKQDGKRFEALVKLATGLQVERDRILFARNYVAACRARAPDAGKEYPGHDVETDLLATLTFSRNDKVKFEALAALGEFAAVSRIGFFVERAERRAEGSRNPNVVLCNSLKGLGTLAARFPGGAGPDAEKDREAVLATLPFLVGVLEREGRNNSASALARDAIRAILASTGAPEALAALFPGLADRPGEPDWLAKMTGRFREESLAWLREHTGVDLPADPAAWRAWFDENRDRISWDARRGRIVLRE